MQRTEILIRPRLSEGVGKSIVGIERGGMEWLLRAAFNNGMRILIVIRPSHFRARAYGECRWCKEMVFNADLIVGAGVFFLFHGQSNETIIQYLERGYGPLDALPIWLQAAAVFLIEDVILYWTHRWFHRKTMWRFHAIHHSTTQVDWLSTYRFHPVNTWLSFTLVDTLMLFIGFSPEAVTVMAGVNMIYSAMVHANLNWTFGNFQYLFASPVFHRWHHTMQEEGLNKNFAPTFPLLDIVFGTFYMPEARKPEHYGAPGNDIPDTFIGQMLWPFRRR